MKLKMLLKTGESGSLKKNTGRKERSELNITGRRRMGIGAMGVEAGS